MFCIRLDALGLLDPRNCFYQEILTNWHYIWHFSLRFYLTYTRTIIYGINIYIYIYLTCILSVFFLASYLACNLPDIYSTSLSVIFLAIYLRFCLASYLTYYPGQCSGQAGPRDSASWRYYSRKKRRQTRAYIKSRDPHLAGGEWQIHCASLGPTPMNFCQETLLLSNGHSARLLCRNIRPFQACLCEAGLIRKSRFPQYILQQGHSQRMLSIDYLPNIEWQLAPLVAVARFPTRLRLQQSNMALDFSNV